MVSTRLTHFSNSAAFLRYRANILRGLTCSILSGDEAKESAYAAASGETRVEMQLRAAGLPDTPGPCYT